MDLSKGEVRLVVYRTRGGQYGYFFPPELISKIKERLPPKVPSTWLSEYFLVRCLERKKGGLAAGTQCCYVRDSPIELADVM